MSKEVKVSAATLEAIKGNNLAAAETVWLAQAIEKKTRLQFDIEGDEICLYGVLIAMGQYAYLVLADKGTEVMLNKAWVKSICPSKSEK